MVEVKDNMEKIVFTIVTAAYNSSRLIVDLCESLVSQTYQNIQWIVQDGASSDDTVKIIESYKNRLNISLMNEKDTGVYDALSKAIKRIEGEWVLFLNADDVLLNKKSLEKLANFIEECNLAERIQEDTLYIATNIFLAETNYSPYNDYQEKTKKGLPFFRQALVFNKKFFVKYSKSTNIIDSSFDKTNKNKVEINDSAYFLSNHFLSTISSANTLSYPRVLCKINKALKVLHINTFENIGGAAIATNRLHQSLLELGVDSHMVVFLKQTEKETVHAILDKEQETIRAEQEEQTRKYLEDTYPNRMTSVFSPQIFSSSMYEQINEFNADIVHLHWTALNFMSPLTILGFKAKIVWTFHDTWGFTGGCHYFGKCTHFTEECGQCPQLASDNPKDISYISFQQKKMLYEKKQATIIALSRSFQDDIKRSSLTKKCAVVNLPNCIDTQVFSPLEKIVARKASDIPQNARVVLFGADSNLDKRKGYDLLLEALEHLKNNGEDNIFCLFFGQHEGEFSIYPSHSLGQIKQELLPAVYASADVFICPSREDNLPNTIMESLSCGTPVVGFDVGGIPDMVEHLVSGYIAKAEDAEDLAKGIQYVLADEELRKKMSVAARKTAEERYSMSVVARQYKELYKQKIKN